MFLDGAIQRPRLGSIMRSSAVIQSGCEFLSVVSLMPMKDLHRLGRAPMTVGDAPPCWPLGGEAGLHRGRDRRGLRLARPLRAASRETTCTPSTYSVSNATSAHAAPSRAPVAMDEQAADTGLVSTQGGAAEARPIAFSQTA